MSSRTCEHDGFPLPPDVLSQVFSYLPLTSLANAMLVSKHWRACVQSSSSSSSLDPWLVLVPSRSFSSTLYAFDPLTTRWHHLRHHHQHLRLVAAVGSLLLCNLPQQHHHQLALLNPFTRRLHHLPTLITPRCNPAIGVLLTGANSFRLVVAGGTTTAHSSAAAALSVELYDSWEGRWREIGTMPAELAVRLTVWTPEGSVQADDGAVYWMTSARAYSVVGFHVERREWREVKVPMAERLHWGALVERPGRRVGLVGGAADGEAGHVWELREGDRWAVVGTLPLPLPLVTMHLPLNNSSNGKYRCVGDEAAVYVFQEGEVRSEMMGWQCESDEWKCRVLPGCDELSNKKNNVVVPLKLKAALLRPTLSLSPFLMDDPDRLKCSGVIAPNHRAQELALLRPALSLTPSYG